MGGDMKQLLEASTEQRSKLGELYIDSEGNHYRYMVADGAVNKNELYDYSPINWEVNDQLDSTVNPANEDMASACVWLGTASTVADGEYAWFFVGPGKFSVKVDGAISSKSIVYVDTVAGHVTATANATLLRGVTPLNGFSASLGDVEDFYATIPLYAVDLP